jgi:hypothetical protein
MRGDFQRGLLSPCPGLSEATVFAVRYSGNHAPFNDAYPPISESVLRVYPQTFENKLRRFLQTIVAKTDLDFSITIHEPCQMYGFFLTTPDKARKGVAWETGTFPQDRFGFHGIASNLGEMELVAAPELGSVVSSRNGI